MLPMQCAMCKNYKSDNKCKAFPKGIPVIVITGQFDHAKPYKGDNGIQFEPIEK